MAEIHADDLCSSCFPSRIEQVHLISVTDTDGSPYRDIRLLFEREVDGSRVAIVFSCGKGQCWIECVEAAHREHEAGAAEITAMVHGQLDRMGAPRRPDRAGDCEGDCLLCRFKWLREERYHLRNHRGRHDPLCQLCCNEMWPPTDGGYSPAGPRPWLTAEDLRVEADRTTDRTSAAYKAETNR